MTPQLFPGACGARGAVEQLGSRQGDDPLPDLGRERPKAAASACLMSSASGARTLQPPIRYGGQMLRPRRFFE